MGSLFPLQAHTAAGRVFYIDGKGVVRSLGTDRAITQVASFPVGKQQEASFAVSPDGKHLLGTVLTIPPKPPTANPCTTGGTGFAAGDWSEDVYAADAGGQTHLVGHRSWPQGDSKVMSLLGWDALGPFGSYPASVGTQGGGPAREGWYGTVVRLDAQSGAVQKQLGSDSCFVSDVAADGAFTCATPEGVAVKKSDGVSAWTYTKPSTGFYLPILSPDHEHVAAAPATVVGRDGTSVRIGPTGDSVFLATGWLDNQMVIGWGPGPVQREMALIRLTAPSKMVDLGFRGTFVGVVQQA